MPSPLLLLPLLLPLLLLALLQTPATALYGGEVADLTQLSLDALLQSNATHEKPLLLQFYAPWCRHCQVFAEQYSLVSVTLADRAYVKRVDGSAYRVLTSRFSVKGFPSFFLIHKRSVHHFVGAPSHESLVHFVESRGVSHGELVNKRLAGPLGPYWTFMAYCFKLADVARRAVIKYRSRPVTLVAFVVASLIGMLTVFAVVLHFLTLPPRARPSRPLPPHAHPHAQ